MPQRLLARLGELDRVDVLEAGDGPLCEQTDLSETVGIAHFGGRLTESCLDVAPCLKVVGGVYDNVAHGLPVERLFARDVCIVDATRGWAPSVAEMALCVAICSLRRVAWWHQRMAKGKPLWVYEAQQFCDTRVFVGGELGTKRVGVVGLGQIGRRVARWCTMLGAAVQGFDPHVPEDEAASWGVAAVELDALIKSAEVLFITVPPAPSARGMIDRERIARLRRGALIVITTRAAAVDMDALRQRIVADELAAAIDVYDVEPLPVDDPLRDRMNVVHTPHVAGRTRDANLRVADVLAEDFGLVLHGKSPRARLTREAIHVRTNGAKEVRPS